MYAGTSAPARSAGSLFGFSDGPSRSSDPDSLSCPANLGECGAALAGSNRGTIQRANAGQVLPQSMGIPRAGARLPESLGGPQPFLASRAGTRKGWEVSKNLPGFSQESPVQESPPRAFPAATLRPAWLRSVAAVLPGRTAGKVLAFSRAFGVCCNEYRAPQRKDLRWTSLHAAQIGR